MRRYDLRPDRLAAYIVFALAAAAPAALARGALAAPDLQPDGSPRLTVIVANLDPTSGDALVAIDEGGATAPLGDIDACRGVAVAGGSPGHVPPKGLPALIASSRAHAIGLAARADWLAGGMLDLGGGQPSTRLLVPVAAMGYYGQDTVVWIRNATADALTVRATLRANGEVAPSARFERVVAPLASARLDLAKMPELFAVPRGPHGFLGALELEADGEMAAWSIVHLAGQPMGVWGVEALRPQDAGETLVAPLVRHRWYGYDTGIAVVNPGDGPVTVDVVYRASAELIGAQPERRHGARSIPAGGSIVFYQGAGGGHGLPDPFVGSAVVEAIGGPVVAVVNDAFELGRQSAAYVAQPLEAAAKELLVPSVHHRAGPWAITTGVQVANPGSEPARLRIRYHDANGVALPPCAGCEALLGAGATHAFVPGYGGLFPMPSNAQGFATIASDVPVLAVVNAFSANGTSDAAAANALSCDGTGAARVALP